MFHTVSRFAIAISFVLAAATSPVLAQNIPRSGDFTVYFTHVDPHPFGGIPVGDSNIAFAVHFISSAVNAAGEGFMHDLRGRCIGLQTVNPSNGTSSAFGYCDWQDAAGDHIFETFSSNGPVSRIEGPYGGVQSAGHFVGGTGKYEGLTGQVTITIFGASTTPDGYEQVIGRKVGTYSLP